jgi:hypothetical protein
MTDVVVVCVPGNVKGEKPKDYDKNNWYLRALRRILVLPGNLLKWLLAVLRKRVFVGWSSS